MKSPKTFFITCVIILIVMGSSTEVITAASSSEIAWKTDSYFFGDIEAAEEYFQDPAHITWQGKVLLARAYLINGRYEKAESFYESSAREYEIWRNNIRNEMRRNRNSFSKQGVLSSQDERDIEFTELLISVAEAYDVQGKFKEAEPFYKRSYSQLLLFGGKVENPSRWAKALLKIAMFYTDVGRVEEAKELETLIITVIGWDKSHKSLPSNFDNKLLPPQADGVWLQHPIL